MSYIFFIIFALTIASIDGMEILQPQLQEKEYATQSMFDFLIYGRAHFCIDKQKGNIIKKKVIEELRKANIQGTVHTIHDTCQAFYWTASNALLFLTKNKMNSFNSNTMELCSKKNPHKSDAACFGQRSEKLAIAYKNKIIIVNPNAAIKKTIGKLDGIDKEIKKVKKNSPLVKSSPKCNLFQMVIK